MRACAAAEGAHFTTWLLSLSICSSDTSRSAVEGTPSSSICKPRAACQVCAACAACKRLAVRVGMRASRRVFFSATSLAVFFSRAL